MASLAGVNISPKHVIPTADGGAKNPSTGESNAAPTSVLQPQQQYRSLEAKKRATADFEQLERLKQQPSLTPEPAPPPHPKPAPTDLSGRLLVLHHLCHCMTQQLL